MQSFVHQKDINLAQSNVFSFKHSKSKVLLLKSVAITKYFTEKIMANIIPFQMLIQLDSLIYNNIYRRRHGLEPMMFQKMITVKYTIIVYHCDYYSKNKFYLRFCIKLLFLGVFIV